MCCFDALNEMHHIDIRGRGLETGSRELILATYGLWTVCVETTKKLHFNMISLVLRSREGFEEAID